MRCAAPALPTGRTTTGNHAMRVVTHNRRWSFGGRSPGVVMHLVGAKLEQL